MHSAIRDSDWNNTQAHYTSLDFGLIETSVSWHWWTVTGWVCLINPVYVQCYFIGPPPFKWAGGGSDLLGLEVTYSEAVDPFEEDLGIRQ